MTETHRSPAFPFFPLALHVILVLSVSADDEPGCRGVRGLWCAHRVDGLACNEMQINIFIDPVNMDAGEKKRRHMSGGRRRRTG